jgi:ubiquinone/menaquinone biosynthesis C-methylase UbiE
MPDRSVRAADVRRRVHYGGRVRESGLQFDEVAEAYDRERPTYPDELVDAACAAARLRPGDRVLEVGCGTGKLTRALLDRGLRVDAVDPGPSMIDRARAHAEAEYVCGRFEDVSLPEASYAAVFSAAAFHWVDPAISWVRAASVLAPAGALVLIQHCGVSEPRTVHVEVEFLRALERIAPEIAAGFPRPRDAETLRSGLRARSANVSEAWSWVGGYDLAVPEAADLFEDVRFLSTYVRRHWTAEQMNAQLRTTSLSFRLGPERMRALADENERILSEFGGRVPLTLMAVAVLARRRA